MPRSINTLGLAGLFAALLGAATARAQSHSRLTPVGATSARANSPITLPTQDLAPAYRHRVAKVIQQPTLTAHAPTEEFPAAIYPWLLDHPDRASLAWRRLGIPCSEITDRGNGQFGWSDGDGTEVIWRTVLQTDDLRVWHAEGHTRISPVTPKIPVQAVVVLRHSSRVTASGRRIVAHEADVYLQTDSRAAATVARMIGPAAPRLAEQGAGQLLLFFSGLSRYFDKHPEDISSLLAGKAN